MITESIRSSIIQFDCPADKSQAVDIIYAEIEKVAAESGLILLGETPFQPYTTIADFSPFAEPINGSYIEGLQFLAEKHRTHICSGLIESDAGKIYNTAVLIGPRGNILHTHRKNDLAPLDEKGGYTAGTGIDVVETELGRIGILICRDTSNQQIIMAMQKHKPDLLLVPAYGLAKADYAKELMINCMLDEIIEEWRMRMKMLGKFCQSYVLRADHCGMENDQVRVGHSIAITPGGYVIAEATMRPGILQVTLDPSSIAQRVL